MLDQIVHTFALSVLNKPVHEMFDTGHSIRTKRITVMTESAATCKMPGSDTGYFVTTASGSRR